MATAPPAAEAWKRIGVVSGIKPRLRSDPPRSKSAELKQLLTLLELALRNNL